MFESNIGRRARAIRVNKDAFVALGVEMTPSFVIISALNLKNEVISHRQFQKEYERTHDYIEAVQALILQYANDLQQESRQLIGVGYFGSGNY